MPISNGGIGGRAPQTSGSRTPASNLSFYGKLALVIVIAVALSEFIPEIVNAVLILILIGLVLGHYKQFNFLSEALASLGK